MKSTPRKPSPKATKCWAVIYRDGHIDAWPERVIAECNQGVGRTVPAWLLTQDQIPAVIEAMAKAIYKNRGSNPAWGWKAERNDERDACISYARAALRAAGVGVK